LIAENVVFLALVVSTLEAPEATVTAGESGLQHHFLTNPFLGDTVSRFGDDAGDV
jgi:hypothetical protein